jgi:hypothetical protein
MFGKVITLTRLYGLLITVLAVFTASCTKDTEGLDTPPTATIAQDTKKLSEPERVRFQEPDADWLIEIGETEKELWGDIATLKAAIKAKEQRLEERERALIQREVELEAREAVIHSREASFRQTELIAYGILGVGIVLVATVVVSEIRGRRKNKRSDDACDSSGQSTKGEKRAKRARVKKDRTNNDCSPDSA